MANTRHDHRIMSMIRPPGDTALDNLRHVVDLYTHPALNGGSLDEMRVPATSNVYGDRVRTGLTLNDLVQILIEIDHVQAKAAQTLWDVDVAMGLR